MDFKSKRSIKILMDFESNQQHPYFFWKETLRCFTHFPNLFFCLITQLEKSSFINCTIFNSNSQNSSSTFFFKKKIFFKRIYLHKPQKEMLFKLIQSFSDLLARVPNYLLPSTSCAGEKETARELYEQITGYYQTFPSSSQIIQEKHALKSQREHLNALWKHFNMCYNAHYVFVTFILIHKHKRLAEWNYILFVAGGEWATSVFSSKWVIRNSKR